MSRNEDTIQKQIVQWLTIRGVCFCAIQNERKRTFSQAEWAKQMGLKSGVPDLLIFTPPPKLPGKIGFALEIKTERGRMTPNQKIWADMLKQSGWHTAAPRGFDATIAELVRVGY